MNYIVLGDKKFTIWRFDNMQPNRKIKYTTSHIFFCSGYGCKIGREILQKYPHLVNLMIFASDDYYPPHHKILMVPSNTSYLEGRNMVGRIVQKGGDYDLVQKGGEYDLIQKGGDYDSNLDETYIEGYKIVKKLGVGIGGSVYLVVEQGTNINYAMKIEHITENEMGDNSRGKREIDFSDTLAIKYPNQFMRVYKYEEKKCKYHHVYDPRKYRYLIQNKEKWDKLEKFHSSPFCSIKIMSLSNGTYRDIIYKINDRKRLLCDFIQVINIAYLTNKEVYLHQDLHPGNIGLIKTEEPFINIMGKNVPLYGNILQAIDYGMVLHKKYNLSDDEKLKLKYDTDIRKNIASFIGVCMLKNFLRLGKKMPSKMEIPNEILEQIEPYLKTAVDIDNEKWSESNRNFLTPIIYTILFFDDFQKRYGNVTNVKLFDFMSLSTFKYIMMHYYSLEKILTHLLTLI